jgi:N-acetylmuramoyl-L-alanine amidase CwlA
MKTMNEKIIWTRFINEGFTREGAAGLMGNLYAESMLNPKNLQNTFEKKLGYTDETYTKAVDSTAYKNFVNDKAGYGLAQWTYHTRKQALLNFARSQNKSIGDLDMQLDFLMKELKESFSNVYKSLKTVASVREASNIVLLQFEKPADQSNTVKNLRSSYAQKYYTQFANLVIKEEEPKQEQTEVKPVVEQSSSTTTTTATFSEATPVKNASFLQPDSQTVINGVIVNEYSLYKHNVKGISMPPLFKKKIIGVTIHNTDWINAAAGTTPAEQYTRATRNGNMKTVRVHFYVDNVCAWQNLPYEYQGWHAADGSGNGNTATIAIECIMSSKYNDKDKRSEDNCARLAAALLKKYGLGIENLYTHTHWLNVRDGIKGTTDYLNTRKNKYKNCPLYILPHWEAFKNKVLMYMGQTVEPQKPVDKPIDTPKPVTESTTSFRIIVQSNVLNVRKDAGVEYPITTKIHKGEVYTIVDTKKSKDGGIWGKLKSGAGWINIGSAYVKK